MPYFVGSGSYDLQNDKHRFVVMPRYGNDIWGLFLNNNKKFPLHTVYRLALQMIDVLEYIHHCTYVHADLKGANMLLGFGKGGDAQTYLVDFGLASHYTTNADYKPDPKKMHNGTIEYTSRDAHHGVPTMRGDLEILAFNLIHWSGATLPWEKEKLLTDPVKVQQSKEKHMNDITGFMKYCYGKESPPSPIVSFVKYVAGLKFNEKPDYNKCRKLFTTGLTALGAKNSGPLQFSGSPISRASEVATTSKAAGRRTRTPTKRFNSSIIEIDDDTPPVVKKSRAKPKVADEKKNPDLLPDSPVKTNGNAKPSTSARVHLGTPGKFTPSKRYQVNIDLDISVDADVVVNVKRKPKVSKVPKELNASLDTTSPDAEDEEVIPKVTKKPAPKRNKITKPSEEDSFIASTEDDNDDSDYKAPVQVTRKRKLQKKLSSPPEPIASKREKLNIPKTAARAGEYKGKKAKN